jgi:hypothetical protein
MKFASSGARDAPISNRRPEVPVEKEGSNPPHHVPDRWAKRRETKPVVLVSSPAKSAIRGQGSDAKSATLDDVMKMLAALHKK